MTQPIEAHCTTVVLADDLWEQIREYADLNGISSDDVLMLALDEFFFNEKKTRNLIVKNKLAGY